MQDRGQDATPVLTVPMEQGAEGDTEIEIEIGIEATKDRRGRSNAAGSVQALCFAGPGRAAK